MKHKIYIVLLLLASLVASCGRDTVLEPTTLTVSPSGLITLDSSEQTKTLVVSTNHEQWASVKNADWVSLSQEGTQLNIKLAANTSAESREADILIIAGEAREQVRITQLGIGVSISTNQESIDLNQWGAALSIDVESNSADWVAETEEAWIHLQPMYAMSELRITVDETTEREDRVGKIYIKTRDGRGLHEVQVTQRGAMYYVLPSMEFLQSSEELRDFELARKSENSQVPDGRFNLYNWGYKTKSAAFPLITYLVYNNRYKTAKVYSAPRRFLPQPHQPRGSADLLATPWLRAGERARVLQCSDLCTCADSARWLCVLYLSSCTALSTGYADSLPLPLYALLGR